MIDKMIADLRHWAELYRKWAAEDEAKVKAATNNFAQGMATGMAIVGKQAAVDMDRLADRWEIWVKYEAETQRIVDAMEAVVDVTNQRDSIDETKG